ncbi:hypothetical protein KUTeg_021329 [Tegillarca granosa]|uniref:S-adenosylmethionine sensor upstream of mTORC1 n=1 Tax=Tegillarca granosa TaxID=220873 RepID=A0ABQ9EEK7_TEGGR|nr:hypothetical protein KUTeg_021329 [Tegillarca granosa]
MAEKEEHLRLAGIVKGVHADLRKKYKKNSDGFNEVWEEHCQNTPKLVEYADAMHRLATDHWGKLPETRIDWCRDTTLEYFIHGGLKKVLEKDKRREAIQSLKSGIRDGGLVNSHEHSDILNNRDNKKMSKSLESVYHCDFLHLETTEPLQIAIDSFDTFLKSLKSPVERLPKDSFHVVVFSLLLEYFPSPYQRWICCQKAYELLMINGLLLIVTPDSHQQHRNASMMKSWKIAIESLGFIRWRYIKLEHLHCMAFRKIFNPGEQSLFLSGITPDMLYIPQDFHDITDDMDSIQKIQFERSDEFFVETINELPTYSDSD